MNYGVFTQNHYSTGKKVGVIGTSGIFLGAPATHLDINEHGLKPDCDFALDWIEAELLPQLLLYQICGIAELK